jgi:hypothetical protein
MPGSTLPQNTQSAPPTGPQQGAGLDPNFINVAKAIRDVETPGTSSPYTARGKSGEYGAYQITHGLYDGLAPKYGITTPLEQATPEEQNKFVYHRVAELAAQGYNPGQIFSIWNSGQPDPTGKVGVNKYGAAYNTPQYVDNAYKAYERYKNAGGGNPDSPTNGLPTYGALFPYDPSSDNGLVAGAKAVGNLPTSAINFGKGLLDMVFHPIKTLEGLGGTAIGGLEELSGHEQTPQTQTFDAFVQAIKGRYGSLDALTNTAVNDPFGLGADIAGILAGGAGLVGKSAELGEVASRAARLAGKPVTGAVSRATAPFSGALDEAAIEGAQRLGVGDLPASAKNTSPTVALFEALAAKGLGGQAVVERAAGAADALMRTADSVVTQAGGAEDLASAGTTLAEGLKKFTSDFKSSIGKIYDAFDSKAGYLAAQTQRTVDTLNAIIDRKQALGDTADVKYFQDKLDLLLGRKPVPKTERYATGTKKVPGSLTEIAYDEHGFPTFRLLKELRTNIGERIGPNSFGDPFVKVNMAQLKQVYGALTGDMRATIKATRSTKLLKELDDANLAYQAGRQVITSQLVKQIAKFAKANQYDKIIPALLRPSASINDIKAVMAITGEEGAKQIQTSFLKQIFDASTGADGNFTASGLTRQLKKYGDKAGAILTPEQHQAVIDMEAVAKALGRSKKIIEGSQTAFLLHQFATLGLVGWGAIDLMSGNPLGFMQKMGAIGLDYGASKFIGSDLGQRVLTYGLANGQVIQQTLAQEGLQPPALTQPSASITMGSDGARVNTASDTGATSVRNNSTAVLEMAGTEATPNVGGAGVPDSGAVAEGASRLTAEQGGVTIDTKTGETPSSGFAFAPEKSTERIVPLKEFNAGHTEQFMTDHADALNQPNNYLGVWVDGDSVYLDVSTVLPDKEAAMAAAAKGEQKAIFDLSTGETHNIEYGKKTGGTGVDEGKDVAAGARGGGGEAQAQAEEGGGKSGAQYFDKAPDSEVMPIEAITPRETPNMGRVRRAKELMAQSLEGAAPKRPPILLDQNGKVIDGNSTLHALKEMGMKDAEVRYARNNGDVQVLSKSDSAGYHATPKSGEAVANTDRIVLHNSSSNKLTKRQYTMAHGLSHDEKVAYIDHKMQTSESFGSFKRLYEKVADGLSLGKSQFLPARKADARAIEKAVDDYGKDFTKIKDMNRGAFVTSDPETVKNLIERIHEKADVVAVKNRISNPALGYRDVLVNVRMRNGTTAEMQILFPEMQAAKAALHPQYETVRAIDGRLKTGEKISAESMKAYKEAQTKMQAGYEAAWAKILKKNPNANSLGGQIDSLLQIPKNSV